MQETIAEEVQAPSGKTKQVSVTIVNFEFQPKDLTVEVGDKVTWINKGARHGLTSEDTFFATILNNGEAFSFTFDKAGEFLYYCQFHGGPGGRGMSGTISVVPAEQN